MSEYKLISSIFSIITTLILNLNLYECVWQVNIFLNFCGTRPDLEMKFYLFEAFESFLACAHRSACVPINAKQSVLYYATMRYQSMSYTCDVR